MSGAPAGAATGVNDNDRDATSRDGDGPSPGSYLARLAARTAATGTVLCLGLDPDPAALPPGFAPDVRGIEAFAELLIDAALPTPPP